MLLLLFNAVEVAVATENSDTPELVQTIEADEAYSAEPAIINSGHIDFGPVYHAGKMQVLLRDDSAARPIWRDPGQTVLTVPDTLQQQMPADTAYNFIKAALGSAVWILPQAQALNTVWAGWNSQHPGLIENISRGLTMRLLEVKGPGNLAIYLQDGNFAQPRQLFISGEKQQEIWLELNTHTHANWVFTKPGAYYVTFEFAGTDTAGITQQAQATLLFAVSDETDPQTVLTEYAQIAAATQTTTAAAKGKTSQTSENTDVLQLIVFICGGLVMASLCLFGLLAAIAAKRQKARVLRATLQEAAAVKHD